MARLQIHTYEPDVSMDAAVPECICTPETDPVNTIEYYSKHQKNRKVLWLLHDAEGNTSDWFRFTQAELFSQEKGVILVCPNGENGFWTNMARGVGWSDMFAIKMWPMVHKMLPTSDRREDNYIAGIGMGGYGAIKLALENPEFFAGAAAFDGWVDAPERYYDDLDNYPEKWHLEDVFGEKEDLTETSLEVLLEKAKLPKRQLLSRSQSEFCQSSFGPGI